MKKYLQQFFLIATVIFMHLSINGQTAQEVARVGITVSNLQRALRFYEEVLTFQKVGEYELNATVAKQLLGVNEPVKVATLQLGEESIELLEFKTKGRPIPEDSHSNDLWFQHIAIVVRDMEAAYQQLRLAKVQFVSTEPQTLPAYLPAAADISAFYFRDPDGHNLEIIHFPAGKGNEKWQQASDKLFLGIDHTAIGIDDTDNSVSFYENALGLKVAGSSENYGSEQEHLNQVFGAHLLIHGLKAQRGFGVEFLNYLAPPNGRKYPKDSKATDLWHWYTSIFVPDANKTLAVLKDMKVLPTGSTSFMHPIFGQVKAWFVRDPDGHAILVMTR
jgi:catechol 2,3-dioxygenase-like lactoylglutathione lyase family enzyme